MRRASPTLEVRASDERSRHGGWSRHRGASERRTPGEGETRLEEIHAARSTAAPRPSAQDPSLNDVFSSGWTYQGRARRAWTGGFKRPEPGMLVHAQFSERGRAFCIFWICWGGVRICNILRAVLIIVIENLFINKAQFTSLSIKDSLLYSRKKTFLS